MESDGADMATLREIGEADPPPADLDDRVLFAIALDSGDAETEVARLAGEVLTGVLAAEQARTLTFDTR